MLAGKGVGPSTRPTTPGPARRRPLDRQQSSSRMRGPSVDPASVDDATEVVGVDRASPTVADLPDGILQTEVDVVGPVEQNAGATSVLKDFTNLPEADCPKKDKKCKSKGENIDYFKAFGKRLEGDEHHWRQLVADSWMKVPKKGDALKKQSDKFGGERVDDGEDDAEVEGNSGEKPSSALASQKTMMKDNSKKTGEVDSKSVGGFMNRFRGEKKAAAGKLNGLRKGEGAEEDGSQDNGAASSADLVPKTFEDMGLFNARMIGANLTWIDMMFKSFDTIVRATVNDDQACLEQETSILALRMNKDTVGKVELKEFGVCMGSSMQALRGKAWTSQYSNAWGHLWDIVGTNLQAKLHLPHKHERAVAGLVTRMDQDERNSFALAVFRKLFIAVPHSESFFKQNNTRLIYIVGRALEMSVEIYQEPTRLVNDVTSLGIRHVMWNIPTTYFEPFVQAMLNECTERYSASQAAIEGLEWSMRVIANIMVRTIEEGSSPLVEAVVLNRPKAVKKALEGYARKDRALACL